MGDCCNCHNEVSRDGSGQLSRYLKALDPSYAPVDDRSIEDLLVFTKRYANQIRFYDIPGSNVSDDENDKSKISWREFFRRDMAVIAASISLTDTAQIKKDYDELRAKLDAHPSHSTFDDLYDPILGMIVKIDGWNSIAIPENPLYADLQLAINSNLKSQAQQIVAYEKGFNYVDASHPLNLDYSAIKNKDVWGLNDNINADISIYQGTDAEDKIRNGALYVDDIFNSFYNFLNQLLTSSESYMQFALEKFPAHQPHMALFIAFLKLFHLAQQQMNGITQRMLDFYYHDVLHLTAKPSIPDKVHIVFELAKDVTEYDVAQGTSLKAGKDAGGKDQVYLTENDLVVNQAKVKEIKNIFIAKAAADVVQADGTTLTKQTIKNIYARPIANSQDGFGAALTDANAKWSTFGKGSAALNASTNLCDQVTLLDEANRADIAEVGFAIASPQLVLQGGNRLLQIQLQLKDNKLFEVAKNFEAQNAGKSFFNISLSGEKGWLDVQNTLSQNDWDDLLVKYIPQGQTTAQSTGIFNPGINIKSASYFLNAENNSIAVFLPISEQAVTGFDNKLHTGFDFKTPLPVIKILLNAAANITEDDYKNLSLNILGIQAKVGSINPSISEQRDIIASGQLQSAQDIFTYHFDGVESLILQNETGVVETGKPFDPFTAYPARGKSFYIGSEEVFNKPLGRLAVSINKTQQSGFDLSEFSSGIFNVSVLHNKFWDPLSTENGNNFDQEHLTINILNHAEFPDIEGSPTITPVLLPRTPIENFMQWQLKSDKGFLQLIYAEQTESDLQKRQNLAIGLEIKEISVSYESNLIRLEPGIDQFFHIYPFGAVETYLSLASFRKNNSVDTSFSDLDKLRNGLLVNARNALLPQFNFLSPYSKYYNSTSVASTPIIKSFDNTLSIARDKITPASRSTNAVRLLLNARSDAANVSNQYTGDTQQGMLFIGLEKLQPLQSISMLFQFAEGSAEDEDNDPPTINWSYLSYNEWKPMKAENITSDGTYGFQTTGIIKIDIPADASSTNTIITDGLIWLCASVTENANRIPQLINIVTQAVEAQFQDNNNDQSHFDNALSAVSISKLTTPVAQINKVQQPFASFDGKRQEIGKEFYTRVSERLRHKGRAINAWDYEHLVLERFPSIYKVKCITHTDPNCLCRNKETTSSAQKHFPLSYNSDFNFDAASEANINSIINDLKNFTQLNATATVFNPKNDNASATLISNKLKAIITADGTIAANRITTNILNSGTERTIDVTLGAYVVENADECCGPQVAPGHVLIVPVSNLKNRNAVNPLQPKTSRRILIEIQEYLKTRTSPFVHVYAKNPVYEQIIVSFKVQFYSGTDKGFYMKKLNDEIVHFLTPWAFDENAEVKFNQKIYASSIINFIEERTYVDFITDFVMGVCCDECCPPVVEIDNGGIIEGNVFDDEDKQKSLAGIAVKIKELNRTEITDNKGHYKFTDIPSGDYRLIAYFSLFNIVKKDFSITDPPDATNTVVIDDFIRGGEQAGYSQDEISAFFSKLCSCTDIEQILKDDPNFDGDIVAKPCTSRSLLVSVPQHIIVPFDDDDEPTPCEKRRLQQTNNTTPGRALTGTRDAIATAPTPVKAVIKTATAKSISIKKANEVAPLKTATLSVTKKIKAGTNKSTTKPKKPK